MLSHIHVNHTRYRRFIYVFVCIWCNSHISGVLDTQENYERYRRVATKISYVSQIHANSLGYSLSKANYIILTLYIYLNTLKSDKIHTSEFYASITMNPTRSKGVRSISCLTR